MIDDSAGQVYALVCGSYNNQTMTPEEEMCMNNIPCDIDQFTGCDVIYQDPNKHALYFGQGVFGGYRCALYSFHELRLDSCVPDILEILLPKKFGTTQDILATTGLAGLGVGIIGTAAAGCYGLFNRYVRQNIPLVIAANENTALNIQSIV